MIVVSGWGAAYNTNDVFANYECFCKVSDKTAFPSTKKINTIPMYESILIWIYALEIDKIIYILFYMYNRQNNY